MNNAVSPPSAIRFHVCERAERIDDHVRLLRPQIESAEYAPDSSIKEKGWIKSGDALLFAIERACRCLIIRNARLSRLR